MLKNARYLTLTGIDPDLESVTTGFGAWTARVEPALRVEANTLAQSEGWILVSTDRAESKGLRRGDTLTVTTFSDTLHKAKLQVIGAFETKHSGYDRLTAFLPIETLRQMIAPGKPGYVNEVTVKLRDTDPEAIEQTKNRLGHALRSGTSSRNLAIITAGDEEDFFLKAVIHQSGLMKIVLFVIMVVAGFLVYATLSMMVTEKTHDIGVLAALGATRSGILQVFLTCGFAIALIGTILGTTSGCITAIYLNDFNEFLKANFEIDLFPSEVYKLPEVPYYLDAAWIGLVALSSLVLGLIAAALPALRAVRHDPLTILRDT
jgi:lipoprotein-releasing system permease protein